MGVKGGLLGQVAAFMEDVKVVDIGGKEQKPIWAGDEEQVFQALVLGTRDYLQKCGFQEVVLGLSGGIDSALVAVVAAEALGKDKVLGVAMPSRFSSAGSVADAEALAKRLGIRYQKFRLRTLSRRCCDRSRPPGRGEVGINGGESAVANSRNDTDGNFE